VVTAGRSGLFSAVPDPPAKKAYMSNIGGFRLRWA
jgi:hypothetical protein